MLHICQCWLPLFLCPVIVLAPLWCHILSKSHQGSSGLLEGCGEEINKEQEGGILGLGGYLERRDDPSLPWKPAMPIGLWSCLSGSVSDVHITSSTYLDLVFRVGLRASYSKGKSTGSLFIPIQAPSSSQWPSTAWFSTFQISKPALAYFSFEGDLIAQCRVVKMSDGSWTSGDFIGGQFLEERCEAGWNLTIVEGRFWLRKALKHGRGLIPFLVYFLETIFLFCCGSWDLFPVTHMKMWWKVWLLDQQRLG